MIAELSDFLVALTYPPALSACLALAGSLLLVARWKRCGMLLWAAAFGWSLLWSLPSASDWLRRTLERQHPLVVEAELPRADAVVVLGGGDRLAWIKRPHVRAEDLRYSRLAAGARAWLAGRAPRVILSGGGRPGRTEARSMAYAIQRLGVPASALLLEERSLDTDDNARYTARLAREHGIRRVLLVTSQLHMPRAVQLFENAGLQVVAVPVPEPSRRAGWTRWVPSRSALWRSGRALKEHLALVVMRLHG
ncbi:MAG TPA: YdcF family protein [Lysobacter sp.]|nr:YdcF family protein [Lysobacter sp.]